jgi:segregation and condensation protein A
VVIVARFLALLELFHESVVTFDQAEALGELMVAWTGQDDGEIGVSAEFDEVDVINEEANEEKMGPS